MRATISQNRNSLTFRVHTTIDIVSESVNKSASRYIIKIFKNQRGIITQNDNFIETLSEGK